MNWLKEKVRSWLFNSNESCEVEMPVPRRSRFDTMPWMHITVYNAIGGKIVEFNHPQESKRTIDDYRDNTQLYIIKEDQDFGKSLSKILTLESLK